jgi:hypothetical protein
MSQSFGKQVNVYWYEIYEIVRATSQTGRGNHATRAAGGVLRLEPANS